MGYFFFHTKSLKSGVCFILTVQLYLKKWKPVFCDGRKINKTGPPPVIQKMERAQRNLQPWLKRFHEC